MRMLAFSGSSVLGGILAIALNVMPAQAQATRTWVSGVGDDANPCSRTAPCKTFAGAISKTATGGEINCLDPGGFGGVTITKSIQIICFVEAGVLVSGTNAIIADSLAQSGRAREAKQLFDTILLREPDHVYALRARINLEIRSGMAKAAISDAQRLVSVLPKSARDRLLLAKAYAAAGDGRQFDRTLWDAFHEIRGNRRIYEVLRAHVAKTDGPDAVSGIDDEYRHQLDAELIQEFI